MNLNPEEHITAGIPREDALWIYAAAVNTPGMLFSIDSALPGRLDRMRRLLHDPITADEATAINDVLHRRKWYTHMIA